MGKLEVNYEYRESSKIGRIHHLTSVKLTPLTDGGRESVPFLQLDFCHLDYEDDLQSLRNSNIT